MAKTFRQFLNDADDYVLGHIYALEANTVNDLFAQYQRAYNNMAIALEAAQRQYGEGDTWSASDALYRARTETLMKQIMDEMRALTNSSSNTAQTAAMQAYYAGFYGKAWITDTLAGGGIRAPLLPAEVVRAAIMKPYEGSTFVDRFIGKDDEFQARIRKSIVQSQINGETMYQAQRRIAAELGLDISRRRKADKQAHKADFNRTQMIARTEIIRTSNLGTQAVLEANKDVLKGWEWKASNDDRTCPICGALDGKQFEFKDRQNPPPAHPQCRCTQIPVFIEGRKNDIIRGDAPTFKQWAQAKGINQNLYGQTYDFRGQKPPKARHN